MHTLRIGAVALSLVALAACGTSSTEPTSLAPSAISARRGQVEPGDDRGNHAQPGDDKGGNRGGKGNDDPANHH